MEALDAVLGERRDVKGRRAVPSRALNRDERATSRDGDAILA